MTSERAALPAGAWQRGDLAPAFRAEAAVLDVDGVLLDVRGSFREAVREAVARVQRLLGGDGGWRPTPEDIVVLKSARGFNDDIDCSIALTALGLAGRQGDLVGVTAAADAAGGGLAGLRRVAPELPRVPGRLVLRVFEELYWGAAGFERRFGAPVEHIAAGSPGLAAAEALLVGPALPRRLREAGCTSVSVLTGRTPQELDAALEHLGWGREDLDAVVTGDMVRKPDPAALDHIVERTGAGAVVYAGDVRDDWELVRRYRAERPDGAAARGVMVAAMGDVTALRALGCDATVASADDLPALLQAWAG